MNIHMKLIKINYYLLIMLLQFVLYFLKQLIIMNDLHQDLMIDLKVFYVQEDQQVNILLQKKLHLRQIN